MKIPPIDRCKNLCERLGRAKIARIRYAQLGTGRKQTGKTLNITNPLIDRIPMWLGQSAPTPIKDIIYGITQADSTSGRTLSNEVLLAILQIMPEINSREVQIMLACDKRSAQRYVRLVAIAIPFILKHLNRHAKIKETKESQQLPSPDTESLPL